LRVRTTDDAGDVRQIGDARSGIAGNAHDAEA
jgi:hypothetical protein